MCRNDCGTFASIIPCPQLPSPWLGLLPPVSAPPPRLGRPGPGPLLRTFEATSSRPVSEPRRCPPLPHPTTASL